MDLKLKDCPNWKAVHFESRTILRSDLRLLSQEQRESLRETPVTPFISNPGHYKAVTLKEEKS